jgi:16S rRNA G966 N2-methylase RsmD
MAPAAKQKGEAMAAAARMLVVMALLALGVESSGVRAQVVYGPPPQGDIVVPYEPTPDNVVEAMLTIGQVTPQDFVMDLGSGDGRIVVTAAKKYGARGLGIELNPDLVKRSIVNAEAAGVSDRVSFQQQDIFKTDLSQATVITMFLFPKVNLQLRPKLLDLKPGTRIVSHFHDMADWRPDQQQHLMTKEHYGDTWIFLWYIPAKVEGDWRWTEQRGGVEQRHRLILRQTYQEVAGTLTTDSLRPIEIRDGKLRGAQLTFWVPIREGGRTARWDFSGEVDGGLISGTERSGSASGVTDRTWRATHD